MSETTGRSDSQRRVRLEAAMAEYLVAADAGEPLDREVFLARDLDLRPELEAFLGDQSAVGHLVGDVDSPEPTVAWEAGASGHLAPPPGDQGSLPPGSAVRYFGDYEVRRELGRGGMGVVYEARQVSLNRPVALKMLKAGLLADGDELRRFKNEAEAVALLDHPGIVPVYEVGEHDGRRYFSMKLVPGGSLVPLLPRYKENPRAAAELVAEAAEAVAHAHARGILHRDLKPANLLVDDAGQAHVTDFGLAKRIEAIDGEQTASGAILGTPAYMSPEQASGRRGSITTATDVYGLGAILYALLTGKAPFGGDSVVDTLEAVRERMPEPPTKLNAKAPQDLETIALKCLAKDPRRRYSTAQALADDLRNWLENRPIAARRVGVAERMWLACKRRPAVAALSVATLLAVVVGAGATIAVQARANAELTRQVTATRAAERLADERLGRAMEAIRDYYTGFAEDALTAESIPKLLRERLLARPLQFYDELTREIEAKENPSWRERALLAMGRSDFSQVLWTLGRVPEARRQAQAASDLYAAVMRERPNDVEARSFAADSSRLLGLNLHSLGEHEAAREALNLAVREYEALETANPGDPRYRAALATTYSNLGVVHFQTNEYAAARDVMYQAIARREALAAANPESVEQRDRLANGYSTLGNALRWLGDAGARAAYEKSIELYDALTTERPEVSDYRHGLALARHNRAGLLFEAGDADGARRECDLAVAGFRALVAERPGVAQYRDHLGMSLHHLGRMFRDLGDPRGARTAFAAAVEAYRALTDEQPEVPAYRKSLGRCRYDLANALADLGEITAACETLEAVIADQERLMLQKPGDPDLAFERADSRALLGAILAEVGRFEESRRSLEEAVQDLVRIGEIHPDQRSYRSTLAQALVNLAVARKEGGELERSREALEESIRLYESLLTDRHDKLDAGENLGRALTNLANLQLDMGEPEQALESHNRAVTLAGEALAASPANAKFRFMLAGARFNRGGHHYALGRLEDALIDYRASLSIAPSGTMIAIEAPRTIESVEAELVMSRDLDAVLRGESSPRDADERLRFAQLCSRRGMHAAAAQFFAEALDAEPKLAASRQAQHRYNAACAAALAGCGQGKDEPAPDEVAKAALRERARGWLEAELDAWSKLLDSEAKPNPLMKLLGAPDRAAIRATLEHWMKDADLAGVRGEAIDVLPEGERTAWRALWLRTAELLGRASGESHRGDDSDVSAATADHALPDIAPPGFDHAD